MRGLLISIVSVLGCGSDTELDAPDDCVAGELHIVHGDVDERLTISNFAFINALGGDNPGTLDVGQGGANKVHVEFTVLVARGGTVAARGNVQLASGLDVGNCETGELSGRIFAGESYWRFELNDLAMTPYCSGTAVSASLGGCFKAE